MDLLLMDQGATRIKQGQGAKLRHNEEKLSSEGGPEGDALEINKA
jgi:hypothetical protein